MRPQVLLIFQTRFEECTAMLKGVAHFERNHQLWTGFLDDEARTERDPQWLRGKKRQPKRNSHCLTGPREKSGATSDDSFSRAG